MKNLIFIISVASIFLIASFYLASLFIPKTIVFEREVKNLTDLPTSEVGEKEPIFLKFFEEKKDNFISQEKDFLEVNLEEMKIRLYKKGLIEKEVFILKKGDPQDWGGSAAGLYKIISGNKLSFSVVADVYMPYALHFYGKYYIHGEPYYPGGEKLQSSVSGGCISLSNEDAKIIYESTELNMPVLIIDKAKDNYSYSNLKLTEFPEISAQSYLVADLDSGFIFTEKNSREQHSIASITKLITAIVLAENVDLRKSILVEEKMLEAYGSTKGLEKNKSFRVVELFYPLLIESSNDAAEVLSYFLGKSKTIKLMNERAEAILMKQAKFVDPSGFDPQNIATAQDLFYLARYILNNRPPLLNITKGQTIGSFGKIGFEIKELWNKNVFINDPTFIGGKTGYIPDSGQTTLFIFHFTTQDNVDRNIVIILLNSKNTETDTQKIYIWLQKNYFKTTPSL